MEQYVEGNKLRRQLLEFFRNTVCQSEPLAKKEKPTFHETRSLGARLYERMGEDPQKPLCHSDKKMTDVYLESDEIEWIDVTADLKFM